MAELLHTVLSIHFAICSQMGYSHTDQCIYRTILCSTIENCPPPPPKKWVYSFILFVFWFNWALFLAFGIHLSIVNQRSETFKKCFIIKICHEWNVICLAMCAVDISWHWTWHISILRVYVCACIFPPKHRRLSMNSWKRLVHGLTLQLYSHCLEYDLFNMLSFTSSPQSIHSFGLAPISLIQTHYFKWQIDTDNTRHQHRHPILPQSCVLYWRSYSYHTHAWALIFCTIHCICQKKISGKISGNSSKIIILNRNVSTVVDDCSLQRDWCEG